MPERSSASRRRWALFIVWAAVAAVGLFAPEWYIPGSPPPWAEAGVHVALFATGTWAAGRAFRLSWPMAFMLGALLAVGTEGLQGALPIYRSASAGDAAWNLLGIGIGVGALGWKRLNARSLRMEK